MLTRWPVEGPGACCGQYELSLRTEAATYHDLFPSTRVLACSVLYAMNRDGVRTTERHLQASPL